MCEFSSPTWAPFRTVYIEYLMKALPSDRAGGVLEPGRLRLPRRVDPGLARPGRSGVTDRRGGLAAPRVAQPVRRDRGPAPGHCLSLLTSVRSAPGHDVGSFVVTSPRATGDVPQADSSRARSRWSLPDRLMDLLPAEEPMAWLRRGEGWSPGAWPHSAAPRAPTGSPTPRTGGSSVSAAAFVRDEVQVPGTGLISFGSFGFADDPGDSVLIVPRVVVGSRRGRSWVTVIGEDELAVMPDLSHQPSPARPAQRHLRRRRDERRRLGVRRRRRRDAGSPPASWRRWCWRATWWPRPTTTSTCAGRCAGWPTTTRCAGPSTSTGCSARPRRCSYDASAAWSPHGCWPARSGVPATTSTTSRWPDSWPGPPRTSRSTSTPSARSPSRWRRTAPPRTCPRCRSCCTCPT